MLTRTTVWSWLPVVVLLTLPAAPSRAQTPDLDIDFDDFFDCIDKQLEWIELPTASELESSDTPQAEVGDEVAAWVDATGLVVNDSDDSHTIFVVYSPNLQEIEVVVFENSVFEVYRKRFRTADVTAVGYLRSPDSPGLCRIYCNGGDDDVHFLLDVPAEIHGGDGDDVLSGGDSWDALIGGDGDDELRGNWGLDVAQGGAGNDVLVGGRGFDILEGGDGDDFIDAQDGSLDIAFGGRGRDIFLTDQDLVVDFDPSEDTRQ